jgi:hypothetical protein
VNLNRFTFFILRYFKLYAPPPYREEKENIFWAKLWEGEEKCYGRKDLIIA